MTEPRVPHEALLVAGKRQRIAEEAVVRLVLRAGIGAHGAFGRCGLAVQDDDARHGVRAVHERRRTLQDLDRVHAAAIDLHAVFVAPLLAFLPDTLAHDHYAVVAQSADDGFRDAAACGQLGHARQVGDGVDDVRRGRRAQFLRTDDADGCRGVLQLRVARDAGNYEFVEFQMAEEHVGRVFLMLVLVCICLRCHRRAYTQQ